MATEHPTGKPYAFIGPASSASVEDSSSSASGEDEAEQPPTANPTVPAPAGQFSTSEENASDDEHEAELLPTKTPSIPAPVGSLSTSEEDSSSGDEVVLAPARQGGDNEDDDGEGEPVGSSNVTAKRGPSPPLHCQGVPEPLTSPKGNVPSPKLTKPSPMKRTAAAAELGEPSSSKKKKKKQALAAVPSKSTPPEKPASAGEDNHTKLLHMGTPEKEVTGLPEKAVAAKKAAKLPKKAEATTKVAKPPALKRAAAAAAAVDRVAGREVAKPAPPSKASKLPKKAVATNKVAKLPALKRATAAAAAAADRVAKKKVAKPSPPSKAAAAVARQAAGKEVAYNFEKRLEERREAYWYLAETLNALEKKQKVPGLYNVAFLNIDDAKAAELDTKIKKQTMAEATLFLKRSGIESQVMRALSKLIK